MRSSGKGGEVVDATVEVGVGGLEGLVGVGPGRVRYRPVQPGQGRIEFLVGVVTDRDDQVGVGEPRVQTGRDGLGEVQSVPSSDPHRARMNGLRRVGARRGRWNDRSGCSRSRRRVGSGPSSRCRRRPLAAGRGGRAGRTWHSGGRRTGRSGCRDVAGCSCAARPPRNAPDAPRPRPQEPGRGGPSGCCPAPAPRPARSVRRRPRPGDRRAPAVPAPRARRTPRPGRIQHPPPYYLHKR